VLDVVEADQHGGLVYKDEGLLQRVEQPVVGPERTLHTEGVSVRLEVFGNKYLTEGRKGVENKAEQKDVNQRIYPF